MEALLNLQLNLLRDWFKICLKKISKTKLKRFMNKKGNKGKVEAFKTKRVKLSSLTRVTIISGKISFF